MAILVLLIDVHSFLLHQQLHHVHVRLCNRYVHGGEACEEFQGYLNVFVETFVVFGSEFTSKSLFWHGPREEFLTNKCIILCNETNRTRWEHSDLLLWLVASLQHSHVHMSQPWGY